MTWPDISLLLTLSPEATLYILHEAFLWKSDLARARGFMMRTEYKGPDEKQDKAREMSKQS